MYRKFWGIVVFNLIFSLVSYSQILKRPNPPTFDYLTINIDIGNSTLYGHPTLFWSKEAFDPLCEPTTGYIIYRKSTSGSCIGMCQLDTVASNIFTYTDTTADGNSDTLTYNIATLGTTKTSPFLLAHSNIFITSDYDSCNARINLNWSLYNGWTRSTIHSYYYLYTGNTDNWKSFVLKDSIDRFEGHYTLTNVAENQLYYFYLKARRDDKPDTTYSNLYHRFTDMPIHPLYMRVDSIIAEDQKVNIYFQIDPSTEITDFRVVRWENSDSVKSIFSKKELNKFSDPSITYFADSADSWAARTRPFYYKIDALNSCPKVVKITNHANSITPKVQSRGMINNIQWDQLFIDTARENKGNYARYRVIRQAYTTTPLAPVYLPETDQLEITDDVHGFEGQGYSIQFCYRIEGFEINTSGDTVMLSRSRMQCTEIVPGVIMPDAIIPTDNSHPNSATGNSRNTLVPIITFRANYTLSVYNRWGNLIFSGENEGWNGRLSNGQFAKEGAYVYRLVVHTSGNNDVIKTGNVTVIYK